MDFSLNLQSKLLCFGQKISLQNFFKKLSKFMAVLVKKSEKVRVIGTKKSKF